MSTHSFKAIGLLTFLGLIWGSGYSLARYATTHGVPPLGYAYWQSLGPALALLIISRVKRNPLPKKGSTLGFYLICGLLGIALPNTNMYFAAAHLPAGLLAVIVNIAPVITYLIALSIREEGFSFGRLFGVAVCVTGIIALMHPQTQITTLHVTHWALIALLTPAAFAVCAVFTSNFRPNGINSLALSTGMLMASAIILTPIVFLSHQFYAIWAPFHLVDGVILLEIVLSTAGYILFFQLIKIAGSVYYSLVGGVVALTGIFWGATLFHERFNRTEMFAMGLIITGILCVTIFKKVTRTSTLLRPQTKSLPENYSQ